ncbi:BA14K family protein [Bartonella doshiae]|uniref:BA14K family protein n=1 Tax=Bartonella doshiae TaxID=33044 RepID=UPI001ABB375C|nr:BA14K family protein [Bartonella doshiae]
MKKVIKLAVLSAMSTATVFMPLNATLADMAWDFTHPLTKEIDDMKRKMRKQRDDAIREMNKEIDILRSSFSRSRCSDRKRGFFSDDFQKFMDDFDGCPNDNDKSKKQQQQQQHHHHHHYHHYHHVENKTYHHIEREKTKHSNIHIDNSRDTLAVAILGTILKKPERPQVVYQIVPQNQVVYQVQQTAEYEPLQQSLESDWLNYCKKKYRSFNPKTGTFRDRNGLEHICYAPIN